MQQVSVSLKSQIETERQEKRDKDSQLNAIKTQILKAERDNKLLKHDLKVKDEERKRTENRAHDESIQKYSLMAKLTDAELERRFQHDMLTQLSYQMENLSDVTRSKNEMLLYQRKELQKLMDDMESQQKEQDEMFRKLNISQTQVLESHEQKEELGNKLMRMNQQVKHWKDELTFEHKEKLDQEKGWVL